MSSLRAGHRFVETIQAPMPSKTLYKPTFSYARQLAAIWLFFGAAAVISPIFWLLARLGGRWISPHRGRQMLHGLFRFFVWWLKKSGVLELETSGLDDLGGLRGTIVAANHPGLLDAIFLLASPLEAACVMRAGLLRNPTLCGSALIGGYVTNDSGPALARQGIETIRGGGNLLIFPEGTRTLRDAVEPFKKGFALVAVKTGAPVQTVLIERRGLTLSKGRPLYHPAGLPLRYRIRLGERFEPRPGESARDFASRLETWFRSRLEKRGGDILIREQVL